MSNEYGKIIWEEEMIVMITFMDIIVSIFIGLIFGLGIVYANKKRMELYKEEYIEWWTRKRYIILYILSSIIIGAFSLFRLF